MTLTETLGQLRAANAYKATWHENGELASIELFAAMPEASVAPTAETETRATPRTPLVAPDLLEVAMATSPPIVLTAEDFPPEVVEGQPGAEFTEGAEPDTEVTE